MMRGHSSTHGRMPAERVGEGRDGKRRDRRKPKRKIEEGRQEQ